MLLGGNIDQAAFGIDLELHIRMWRQNPGGFRPQEGSRGMISGRDADRSGGLASKVIEGCELRLDLIETGTDGAQEPLARFGR